MSTQQNRSRWLFLVATFDTIASLCHVLQIPQAAAERNRVLNAARHTSHGSQAIRRCKDLAFADSVNVGDEMTAVLAAQRWEYLCASRFNVNTCGGN